MTEVFLYPFIFLLCYSIAWYFNQKRTWKISLTPSKILKNLHYISLFFILFICILNFKFGYDLRGVWTSRIGISVSALLAFFTYWVIDKAVLGKIENMYFAFLAKTPIIGGIFLLIPMLGYLTLGAVLYQFATPYEQIYYADEQIRVQTSFTTRVNTHKIEVFKKEGMFEKSMHHEFIYTPKVHKITTQEKGSSREFEVHFEKELANTGDSTFIFSLETN
jgi:hypothetical protein